MPADIGEFDAYMHDMLDGGDLFVTSAARELALQIVMRPPVGLTKRPILELVNFVTVGLLPPQLRRQFGLSWDPLRALMLRGGGGVRQARARAAGAGAAALRLQRARHVAGPVASLDHGRGVRPLPPLRGPQGLPVV